jgi:hypothetical protein
MKMLLFVCILCAIVMLSVAMLVQVVFAAGEGDIAISDQISVDASQNETITPSPPHVYADLCQQGASASGRGGAGAIVTPEPVCQQIKIMELYRSAFKNMSELCRTASTYCDETKLQYYFLRQEYAMKEADRIVQQTKHTGQAARYAYDLLPVGALIWLGFAL